MRLRKYKKPTEAQKWAQKRWQNLGALSAMKAVTDGLLRSEILYHNLNLTHAKLYIDAALKDIKRINTYDKYLNSRPEKKEVKQSAKC